MEKLPYNENDGYVGFWVSDEPYIVEGNTYVTGKRLYLIPNVQTKGVVEKSVKKECETVKTYFDVLNPNMMNKYSYNYSADFHKNGRRYYAKFSDFQKVVSTDTTVNLESNTHLSKSPCIDLSTVEGAQYNLASLICSQFSGQKREWPDLLETLKKCDMNSDCYECTDIGHKIAASLIKIAALRIFADPEQSILELPVNSIDSYIPEMRVGKFGMGFFSFLYWIIGHPLRKLYIYSWSKTESGDICGYRAIIKDVPTTGLSFEIKILETSVKQTGTFIYLDTNNDSFDETTLKNFTDQLTKLKRISRVKLFWTALGVVDVYSPTHYWKMRNIFHNNLAADDIKDEVYIHLSKTKIFIEDYAGGIPLDVLFGSLFVPSLSTKTIKDSVKIPRGWRSSDTALTLNTGSGITILVSGVGVVQLKPENTGTFDGIVIDMPPNTRLPVSRDDIILDFTTFNIFVDEISELFRKGKFIRKVDNIQKALNLYLNYTSSAMNKLAILKAVNIFENDNVSHLTTNDVFNGIRNIDNKSVLSITMNIPAVEYRLVSEFKTQNDVWFGKRVVTIPPGPRDIETYSFSSLVFVTSSFQNQSNWATRASQSKPNLGLAPYLTNYGKEKSEAYRKNMPLEIITQMDIDLYESVMAVHEGLKIYFKMSLIAMGTFKLRVNNSIYHYSLEGWRKISYALLSKFSKFKGNQTYGGSQYNWSLGNGPTITIPPVGKELKYSIESVITCINSNVETQNTVFLMSNHLLPPNIATSIILPFWMKSLKLHETIIKYSNSLIDYTICGIVLMKAINTISLQGKVFNTPVPIIDYAKSLLLKIQDSRYSQNDLDVLYRWIGSDYVVKGTFPAHITRLTDEVIEWWKIASLKIAPFSYIPLVPTDKWTTIRTSQLISYLFSNKQSSDIMGTFKKASEFKTSSNLQITEIAINEGTTKEFVAACLTELCQNSVDAIRSTNAPVKAINIKYADTENNTFTMMVEDYVGMNPQSFLYIGIPFLSTKTASDIVTGEMGSGFFNVYRESQLVVIDTHLNGITYISYDTPISDDSGRIVDIERKITSFADNKRRNSTKIMIRSKSIDEVKRSEYLGIARYTSEKILYQISAFDNITIDLNGHILPRVNKVLMFTIGYFDVYFHRKSESTLPSYVFTKGIPFAPLTKFYDNYPNDVKIEMEYGIIVNIRHGGFTPVQTRTRLNMPEESKLRFTILLDYIVLVKLLQLFRDDYTKYAWMYSNVASTANISALGKFIELSKNDIKTQIERGNEGAALSVYLRYINFDLIETLNYTANNTLVFYTNKLMNVLKDDNPLDPIVKAGFAKKLGDLKISSFSEVDKLAKFALGKWFNTKNKPGVKKVDGKVVSPTKWKERDVKPDVRDTMVEPYIKIWIETFIDIAITQKINGWSTKNVQNIHVVQSDKHETASGYYNESSKTITINTISWTDKEKDDIKKIIKNIKSDTDFQLINNSKWLRICGYMFPANTCVHELEHARKHSVHSGNGAHDSSSISLWEGDIPRERTFDQIANDVFSRVLGAGFYEELYKRYKKAKLCG